MTDLAVHWVLELAGSGCWACARGFCVHRWHRIAGDVLLTGLISALTLRMVG